MDYAVQATLKLQRERLKSMEAKQEAVDDFDEYLEVSMNLAFFSGHTSDRGFVALLP